MVCVYVCVCVFTWAISSKISALLSCEEVVVCEGVLLGPGVFLAGGVVLAVRASTSFLS